MEVVEHYINFYTFSIDQLLLNMHSPSSVFNMSHNSPLTDFPSSSKYKFDLNLQQLKSWLMRNWVRRTEYEK